MTSPRRHPVARNYPRQRGQPARIELNVLKLDADGNSIYDDDIDPSVCDCFPTTSSKHIPSMLYDHIHCPHHNTKHIQPAQQQVFAYPWTANTEIGPKKRDKVKDIDEDSLASGRLSIIREESPRTTPNITRTAPPFADVTQRPIDRVKAPFTAPADSRWESHGTNFRRAESVPSLTGYYSKKPVNNYQGISTPYVQRFTPRRPVIMEDRHFDGHYIDPSKTFFKFVFIINVGISISQNTIITLTICSKICLCEGM